MHKLKFLWLHPSTKPTSSGLAPADSHVLWTSTYLYKCSHNSADWECNTPLSLAIFNQQACWVLLVLVIWYQPRRLNPAWTDNHLLSVHSNHPQHWKSCYSCVWNAVGELKKADMSFAVGESTHMPVFLGCFFSDGKSFREEFCFKWGTNFIAAPASWPLKTRCPIEVLGSKMWPNWICIWLYEDDR